MAKDAFFVRSLYNYDREAVSRDTGLKCGESLTRQSFMEEADINVIAKRFGLTGELPEGVRLPRFVDFQEVFSFQDAANVVRAAEESFAAMPAHVRSRFGNDAAQFVAFCSDDANYEEAKRLGLVDMALADARKAQEKPTLVNPTPGMSGAAAAAPAASTTPPAGGTGGA